MSIATIRLIHNVGVPCSATHTDDQQPANRRPSPAFALDTSVPGPREPSLPQSRGGQHTAPAETTSASVVSGSTEVPSGQTRRGGLRVDSRLSRPLRKEHGTWIFLPGSLAVNGPGIRPKIQTAATWKQFSP
jgi:hypothetical protein